MDDNNVGSIFVVIVFIGICLWGCHTDHKKAERLDQIEATAQNAEAKAEHLQSELDDVKSTLDDHNID